MSEAATTVTTAPAMGSPALGANSGSASSGSPDVRRVLQLVLASVWLLDGLLQFQPFMFSRAFGSQMLAATAHGNPSAIAHSITWADIGIGHHSVVADSFFAVIQLLIGFGIAWRPTLKPALVVSIVWSSAVWWFGEGLGGLFSGSASPLNGAPGAVILYAVAAVLLWPAARPAGGRFVAARAVGEPVAKGLWAALWGTLACVAVLGVNHSPQGVTRLVTQMAGGEPTWMAALDHHVADLLGGQGLGVSVALAASLGVIALGVFLPVPAARVITLCAFVVSGVIWVIGENFGGIFSGSGTDPNSGPLLMLIAAAYWPHPRRLISPRRPQLEMAGI